MSCHEGFQLRLSIDCPSCRNPLPIGGLYAEVGCTRCGDAVDLRPAWPQLFGPRQQAWALGFEDDQVESVQRPAVHHASYSFGRQLPRCPGCQAALPVPLLTEGAAAGGIACPQCSAAVAVRAADAFAREIVPEAVLLVGEGGDGRALVPASAPVVFACMSCSGALRVDGTARVVSCQYCQADNYLPDGLWRTLHPVPKVEPFTVLIELPEDTLLRRRFRGERVTPRMAEGLNAAQVSEELLAILLKHDNPDVRVALARNPDAPAAAMAALVTDPVLKVQEALAQNPALPPDIITRLAAQPSDSVRGTLAEYADLPAGLLVQLARTDRSRDVQRALALRHDLSPEGLRALAENPALSVEIRRLLAKREDLSPEVVERLMDTPDRVTRRTLERYLPPAPPPESPPARAAEEVAPSVAEGGTRRRLVVGAAALGCGGLGLLAVVGVIAWLRVSGVM